MVWFAVFFLVCYAMLLYHIRWFCMVVLVRVHEDAMCEIVLGVMGRDLGGEWEGGGRG